ncbi:MAG: endolytic transglycosylase MltG [Phototrophicaceae bacterium]
MLRLAKFVIFLGFIAFFVLVVAGGFLLIISGGDPINYVRTAYLSFSLSDRQDELNMPAGIDATERIVEIPLGSSPTTIAQDLSTQGLILDADLFVLYVRVEGLDTQLEAGTYFINQTMTIPEIALMLTDSRSSSINFRVAEGWRIEQIAEAIDQNPRFGFTGDQFLLVARADTVDATIAAQYGIPIGASLEGFMFPDTYVLSPSITAAGLVNSLFVAFQNAVGDQLRIDAQADGYSLYQMVTLASIVERESVWNDENVLIASAYRNRLEIGMNMEADPTVQYGINGARGGWWDNITIADYRGVISPYNTYLNNGLPPGPIANPSLSAIRSAVYPAETNYIFFRAKCDGSNYHNFAVSFDEHLANGC